MVQFPEGPDTYADQAPPTLSVASGVTAVPLFLADFGPGFSAVTGPQEPAPTGTSGTDSDPRLSGLRASGLPGLGRLPVHARALRGIAAGDVPGTVVISAFRDLGHTGTSGRPTLLQLILRHHFDAGGGYAYLGNTHGRTLKETLAESRAYPDIAILVPIDLWTQGPGAAAEQAREVVAAAAGRGAMAVLHADRRHDVEAAVRAFADLGLSPEQSRFAAAYHPWLSGPGPDTDPVPPVGAVTGTWSRTDRAGGVWKAPANAALPVGLRPDRKVDDAQQTRAGSVNLIREFPGRGTVLRGARTLDEGSDPTWRSVPVTRLLSMIRRDVETALRPLLFEPDDETSRRAVRSAVENYLHHLFQQGAFAGDSPKNAYFVRIGTGATMTDADTPAGILTFDIGVAPLRPDEFVTLEFTQQTATD
ncbi:phage tail sheath C-terminal domain-containing protein [Streptomyces sp. NPDC097619]|uniref:phage tail sheath family protein n=1 Tax=Streptomyces sp. NPDC097619 TaxID=3157228 RepID=UPI003330DBC8